MEIGGFGKAVGILDSTAGSPVGSHGNSAIDSAVDSIVPRRPSEPMPNAPQHRSRALGELWGAVRGYGRGGRTVLTTALQLLLCTTGDSLVGCTVSSTVKSTVESQRSQSPRCLL